MRGWTTGRSAPERRDEHEARCAVVSMPPERLDRLPAAGVDRVDALDQLRWFTLQLEPGQRRLLRARLRGLTPAETARALWPRRGPRVARRALVRELARLRASWEALQTEAR